MTDHSDPNSSPLPVSYRLTIVLSVGLMFALGLAYFGFRNQRIATSYQVYGSPVVNQGVPAIYRIVQFDNDGSRGNLPVRVKHVVVKQQGQDVAEGEPLQDVAAVPADARIPTDKLSPGEAVLSFSVEGWDGETRTLELPITVEAGSDDALGHARLRPGLDAPIDAARARMDLTLPSGGMVEGLDNRVWIRFADPGQRPADVHLSYHLADGAAVQAQATGRLGIAPITLSPRGPNQNLFVDVPFRGETVAWEEMVAPTKLARITGAPLVVPGQPPLQQQLAVETDGADRALFCSLWLGPTMIRIAAVETVDGHGKMSFELPRAGLYWVTCDDHFLSSSEFLAERPLIVGRSMAETVARLAELGEAEAFFSHWPSPEQMTEQELALAGDYFQDRLAPVDLKYTQLSNTYDQDVAELRATAETQRDTVLILWAIAGGGLLLWAVAVTIRQHKRLVRSFREFQDGEDVGDDLATQGITRKRSFVPAILIGLTVIANVAAFVWLLRLIFF